MCGYIKKSRQYTLCVAVSKLINNTHFFGIFELQLCKISPTRRSWCPIFSNGSGSMIIMFLFVICITAFNMQYYVYSSLLCFLNTIHNQNLLHPNPSTQGYQALWQLNLVQQRDAEDFQKEVILGWERFSFGFVLGIPKIVQDPARYNNYHIFHKKFHVKIILPNVNLLRQTSPMAGTRVQEGACVCTCM